MARVEHYLMLLTRRVLVIWPLQRLTSVVLWPCSTLMDRYPVPVITLMIWIMSSLVDILFCEYSPV